MMHGQKNIKLYVSVFFSNYSKCYNCVFVCVCVCVCVCVIVCSRMRNGPFWRLYQNRYMWISWSCTILGGTAIKTWMFLRCVSIC